MVVWLKERKKKLPCGSTLKGIKFKIYFNSLCHLDGNLIISYLRRFVKHMNKKNTKNFGSYSIGLDIGTNSIGWAVIGNDYKLLKINGKDAWGAYLFEKGQQASQTRIARSTRRRYERRRERIRFLQELLNDDVLAADDSFYIRLKESFLLNKDIDAECGRINVHNLFDDENYTDTEYYDEYPTIYHLRKALYTVDKRFDARLIYLALHHIVKYRGNFIYEGKDIDFNGGEIPLMIKEYFEALSEINEIYINYYDNCQAIYDIVKDKTIIKKDKEKAIADLFNDENKKVKDAVKHFAKFILGYTGSIDKCLLLNSDNIGDSDESKLLKFSFKDESYDENENSIMSILGNRSDLLLKLKEIYLNFVFGEILNGGESISDAMIAQYDKYGNDLRVLKSLFRRYLPDKYNAMFREAVGNNFVNYAGIRTDKSKASKRISQEVFYKAIRKDLEKMPHEDSDVVYCINSIDNENFLPRINDVSNGSIPYQMQEKEMIAIIDNQAKYYDNLKENKDKILSILTFRRPYYFGTLKGKFSWNTTEIEGKITPWNFYDKVDAETLAKNFITKMLNYCCIFKNEEVLPTNSIVYQSHNVLNELNKIKIDEKPLHVDLKKDLFLNLMCVKKNVTVKNVIEYLKRAHNMTLLAGEITGLNDGKFNSTMSTLIDFKNKLRDDFKVSNLNKYEEAIRTITLFDDKKMRVRRLSQLGIFTDEQIKELSALRYAKWGKFSAKLLHDINVNGRTILDVMFNDSNNPHINEIIFCEDDKYGFKALLPKVEDHIEKFDYIRDIKPLYCSPSVKKSIWNTLNIVTEIEKLTGRAPDRIFIESTESTDIKKAKDSRVVQLKCLYKSIEKEAEFNKVCSEKIATYDANEKLSNDKLYLWFIQLGRCMYSGEIIDIDDLNNCEIDHIVPRCLIKDDSFENRVLVKRLLNQNKKELAIAPEIRSKMLNFWKFLHDKRFIGSKKFSNLLKNEFSDEDCARFINRQLVETGQTVKEVKKLLSKRYSDAVIEGVKAGMNSQFRHKYMWRNDKSGFYKLRLLNDYHHAKDAYLTAVVGQFTTVACPLWGQNSYNKILNASIKEATDKEKLNDLVNKRYGIVLDLMEFGDDAFFAIDDDGEYQWNNTYYCNIFDTMAKNNCLIVKQKKFIAENEFYNQTIYSPRSDKKDLIPLRNVNGTALPTKYYGGYSSVNPAYFAVIKYMKGKKCKYEFVNIPTMVAINENSNKNAVIEYLQQKYSDKKVDVATIEILKKVYKFQLIKMNGQYLRITGETELNNATQLFVLPKYEKLLYLIEKKSNNKQSTALSENREFYDAQIKEFLIYFADVVKKHCPIYAKIADNMLNVTIENYEKFSYEEKIKYIFAIIKALSPSAMRENLVFYGGSSEAGRLFLYIKPEEVEWIDSSYTGLYSKVVKGINF